MYCRYYYWHDCYYYYFRCYVNKNLRHLFLLLLVEKTILVVAASVYWNRDKDIKTTHKAGLSTP